MLPEILLPPPVLFDRFEFTQTRVARYQAPSQPLKRHRLIDGEAEVSQLDLAVRARECEGPRDSTAVVILLDQQQRRFFCFRVPGGERHACRRAWRQPERETKADDRIEYGPRGIR